MNQQKTTYSGVFLSSWILSFDWATKKSLTIYDSKTKKIKSIPNSIEQFDKFLKKLKKPAILLFEFGGGDTFKIMAFRAGHTVLQIPGKKIKDFRDSLGKEKSDEMDARLIYEFYIENDGRGATGSVRNSRPGLPSPSSNKNGGGAKSEVRNFTAPLPSSAENNGGSAMRDRRNSKSRRPSPFSLFMESNAEIAEIKILYREHESIKAAMVQEKNRLLAFDRKFKIARVANDRIAKIKNQKQASIAAKEKELQALKKILEKKLEIFPVWKFYEHIKGIGTTIVAGLIGELGGRHFEDSGGLKHYGGMMPRAAGNNYNRYVKAVLFQFAECIIKARTPRWRQLYDSMKIYYSKKHSEWRPGKIDAHAKKFIETKFLIEFYANLGGGANGQVSTRIESGLPAPLQKK